MNRTVKHAAAAGLSTINQIRIVEALASGPESMTWIACTVGISTAAVTQIADRLEELRLVERVRVPHDRRAVLIRLTPAGRELAARIADPEPAAAAS